MPFRPLPPAPPPRLAPLRAAWLRRATAGALVAAACGAWAQTTPAPAPPPPPTPAGDAVLHLLQERGLVPEAGKIENSPIVQQMRDSATEMVLTAMNFLGVRYVRGGNTAEQGFDCSGFTRYVFERSLGLVLPRRADEQAKIAGLLSVKQEELKPGDLVFFNTMRRAFSHVGIYVGEGKFIHAPRAGAEVRIEDMRQAYWAKRFNGARRAEVPTVETPAAR
ncbi:C40 family peptidase [Rubrivivax rivuli]|uniref:NlpC/P60 family protein n=1 Tax=Rubrivivax rivuli TaxID=1862385 RepID=A0A437RIB8_9BURK|nr:C40 family peptidase [Rubrivivax rivuli]RVU46455.1 NlpC/P60 family protein [Rubrivivax rivuli]